jgi:hypothetical protein
MADYQYTGKFYFWKRESAYGRWVEPWHAPCVECRGHILIDGESADHFVGRMAAHSCSGR